MTKAGDSSIDQPQAEPTSIASPLKPAARFLNQGSFADYNTALLKLADWVRTADAMGYAADTLTAWITVSEKLRVQLATRSYWKHLTPRGRARDALEQVTHSRFVLCILFRRGTVQALPLDEVARIHAPLLELAQPHPVSGVA